MPIATLEQLDALLRSTAAARRELVVAALSGGAPSSPARALLEQALASLEALPAGADGRVRLDADGTPIELTLGPETGELRRDLAFLDRGEPGLRERLAGEVPGFESEVADGVRALRGAGIGTLLADRDGTLLPYFSRYAGSVQSAWSAMLLTRCARALVGTAAIVSSGPLEGPGLIDLSVVPAGAFVLAASKGREWLGADGRRGRQPIVAEQQRVLDELDRRLTRLLEAPEHRRYARIGSGYQRKYGQLTVARQDAFGSIPREDSDAFLEEVRKQVSGVDPSGSALRIEDTGKDVEVHLTVRDASGRGFRDFDKGDGVRLLESELSMGLSRGPCLVCGDTAADVAMLRAATELAPRVHALFVARDDALRRRVREADPDAVLVGDPATLVAILGALARPA